MVLGAELRDPLAQLVILAEVADDLAGLVGQPDGVEPVLAVVYPRVDVPGGALLAYPPARLLEGVPLPAQLVDLGLLEDLDAPVGELDEVRIEVMLRSLFVVREPFADAIAVPALVRDLYYPLEHRSAPYLCLHVFCLLLC